MLSYDVWRRELDDAIARLRDGASGDEVESLTLDCKREVPCGKSGNPRQNEEAAQDLAEAASCFANSAGGVVLVGVDDKRRGEEAFLGVEVDRDWLQRRIWELTTPNLRVEIEERSEGEARLLAIYVSPGFDLYRYKRKLKHRIHKSCEEMSFDDQQRILEERRGFDWSQETSGLKPRDVKPAALERARFYLRASGEQSRIDLAQRGTTDIVRQLGLLSSDGCLNRAGQMLFVGSGVAQRPLLAYRSRRAPGSDSLQRIEDDGRPLIEVFYEIEQALSVINEERELRLRGLLHPRVRLVPEGAAREAIINALAHRDYRLPAPVDVEFIGNQLVVDSPGGFMLGIGEHNILSHPSKPRNPTLLLALRGLRLAEREGVGVARMTAEMIRSGHRPPVIRDEGGRIRCVLMGGEPVEPILELISGLEPTAVDDVEIALLIHILLSEPTVSAAEAAPVLQKSQAEAEDALVRAQTLGLLEVTADTNRRRVHRYRFTDAVRRQLGRRLRYLTTSAEQAQEYIVGHLKREEQIKSENVQEMLGVSAVQASRILRSQREAKVIKYGSSNKTGAGVFYIRGPRYEAVLHDLGLAAGA